MSTLYDLLQALPGDDADGLRTAFRKAVKGAHPDLKPDDPDAASKFRQIVNANQILGDEELRAAYDDLLDLAREEDEAASRQAAIARMHKLASGLIAIAGISAATAGGFLLFMHMSAASIAWPNGIDAGSRPSAQTAAETPAESSELSPAKLESAAVPTIQHESKFLPAYADSRVIFYRVRKRDHVFPEDHAFAEDHVFPDSAKASHLRPPPTAIARRARRAWRIRMAAQDPSRGEGFTSAMVR
jgi:curved DNA-binding protein CbpA